MTHAYRLPDIHYVRLRATFRALEAARLPAFKGSLLRGAFGHALRRSVCTMGPKQPCESCSLRGPCVHTRLFETFLEGAPPPFLRGLTTAPRPYVFEPLPGDGEELGPGETLTTDLLLFGQATDLQAYAVLALERMAAGGLGPDRRAFRLEEVAYPVPDGGAGTWATGFRAGGEPQPWSRPAPTLRAGALPSGAQGDGGSGPAPERLSLRFATPTRIRVDGRLRDHLPFRRLAFPMLRRVLELAHCHVPGAAVDWELKPFLERADDVRVAGAELQWQPLARYSNRQGRKHSLSGFTGTVDLEGPLAPFLPLLRAAEVVHVGKGATFGLGKVEVEVPDLR